MKGIYDPRWNKEKGDQWVHTDTDTLLYNIKEK